MPGITKIDLGPPSTNYDGPDASHLICPSPEGDWEIVFSHPGEIAMGASTWGKVALRRGGLDVSSEHPDLRVRDASIDAIEFLHPWNSEGSEVVVPLIGRKELGAIVYDVVRSDRRQHAVFPWEKKLLGLIWSPVDDRILLLRSKESEVVSGDFEHIRSLPFGTTLDSPMGGWTTSGQYTFVLGPRDQPTVLRFFDGTGAVVAEESFDPESLLPYDKVRFRELSRGRVLVDLDRPRISWTARMFEQLLSQWWGGTYNSRTGELSAWVYRPTFETLPDPQPARARLDPGDGVACLVRPQWVHARVTE